MTAAKTFSNIPLHIVILAAGQGKRMVSSLPKVLHKIAGKSLLQHALDTAAQLKPETISIVYGHGGEQVRAAFQNAPVQWVEQTQQLGTGHALQCALPALPSQGHTLVLYGDVPLMQIATLRAMCAAARTDTVVLLTDTLIDPTGYGRIVRDSHGEVQRIVEQKDANPREQAICEINTGMLLLPNIHLAAWLQQLRNHNAQGEYYLTDVIALAVAQGCAIHTVQPAEHWEAEGVNSKAQLAQLERTYQQAQAKQLLIAGVTLLDPARIDIRGTLTHAEDVSIDVGCIFEGTVQLGARVQIGAYCVLRNCTLDEDVILAPFTHIDGAHIGTAAKIGPFARLRPQTILAANTHIGNFVEIKNSQIGIGSKVNHLSYIGDAKVGAQVNIGAGTITCNYDGANKWQTTIEDNAFIGSGSMLVAPVVIGQGATIGAGSTITKTAPNETLTVARAKQISLANWQRPIKKQN